MIEATLRKGKLYRIEKKSDSYSTAAFKNSSKSKAGEWTNTFINVVAFNTENGSYADQLAKISNGEEVVLSGVLEEESYTSKAGETKTSWKLLIGKVNPRIERVAGSESETAPAKKEAKEIVSPFSN